MKKIRIFLIEDNRLLREGIATTLKGQADFSVVASSDGNHDSLRQVRQAKPDVLLMDLGLRARNGLRVVATLSKELPNIKVIGMGLIPTQLDIVECMEAGASGFILKDATVRDFLTTIRSVACGEKVLPPPLTGSLFSHIVEHALRNGKGEPHKAVKMTQREREITGLIAEALSNKEIARRLNIATYTVKSHVHNILEKLALHSRLEIAKYSRDDEASPT